MARNNTKKKTIKQTNKQQGPGMMKHHTINIAIIIEIQV